MNAFVRVRVQLPNNRKRSVWAEKAGEGLYEVVNKYGDLTGEIIITAGNDVLYEVPAMMSLHYGELEVVQE